MTQSSPTRRPAPLLWFPLALAAALLVACPESPPDVDDAGVGAGAGPAGAAPGGGPGGPGGGTAGPPAAGTGAAPPPGGAGGGGSAPEMDPEMENPQHTQEALASDSSAVNVAGTLICDDGDGPYRVRLFVPPPDQGGPEEGEDSAGPPSPLVNVEIVKSGPFTFRSPKADALVVLAYEDLDSNGLPTLEEPQFGPLRGNPVAVKGDVSDLTLDCSKPLPAPEPRMDTMPPPSGDVAPDGGPPVDAVPAATDGPPPADDALLPADGAQGPPPDGMQGPPPGDVPAGGPPPE